MPQEQPKRHGFNYETVEPIILWTGAGLLAWSYVCVLEWATQQDVFFTEAKLSQLAFLISLSGVYTLQASAAVALLHLANMGLRRVVPGAGWFMALLLTGLAAYPAWLQAGFLTSGDYISQNPWAGELQWVLCSVLCAAGLALWMWHLELVRVSRDPTWTLRPQSLKWVPDPVWLGLLILGGLLAAVALVYWIATELTFYAYLAAFLVPPAWLLSTTVTASVLRLHRAAGTTIAALAGVLFMAAGLYVSTDWADRQEARSRVCSQNQIAGITNLQAFGRRAPRFRFDIAGPARFLCEARKLRTMPKTIPTPAEARRNVILISIDAIRTDMLDFSEDDKELTPNLRAFGEQSVFFRKAVTTYPATLFAVGSALTGLNASQILFSPAFPANVFTMTKDLFDAQFMALPNSKWFKQPSIEMLFVQGTENTRSPNASSQASAFIRRLRDARRDGKRTFAWVHFFDPHMPYRHQPGFRFGNGKKGAYLSEVAYSDHHFGRLMDYLVRDGWLEDSLIIVFGDHGQALGERRYWGHHVYLNSYISDIPIYVYAPDIEPGVSDELVSIADITPTVLHFLDAPVSADFAGHSLFTSGGTRPHYVVSEAFPLRSTHLFDLLSEELNGFEGLEKRIELVQTKAAKYDPKVAVVHGDYRLIVNRSNGAIELFTRYLDIKPDDELSEQEPELTQELVDHLKQWHAYQSQWFYCRMVNQEREDAN